MANRFFTDNFTGNVSTFIVIPSYTGDITYDCYPRANNVGLPGSPSVVVGRWNTVTVSVSALTVIGAGFNGIIANILGVGLDIPLAQSDGSAEAPATLSGPGFIQEEYEEINPPYNDWAKLDNLFTPGSFIVEAGETNAFPLILNNIKNDGTRYYVDASFREVDGGGAPTGGTLDYAATSYKFNGESARQMQSGAYGIGTPWYTTGLNTSHYVQLVSNPAPQRVELTSRVSEVLEFDRVDQDWTFILGNGQSLSVGGETTTSDVAHQTQIRNNNAHLSYGNGRPQAGNQSQGGNPGFAFIYEGIRPWIEEPIGTTHVWSMLSGLDARDFPAENSHTLTLNEGVSGQTLVQAASYGPDNAGLALATFSNNQNLGIATERAVITWIQGEADSATDPATYLADLRAMHDDYIAQVSAARPAITSVPMMLDQPGSQNAYWQIAATLFKYALDNDDAYFSTPKYHINSQFPIIPGGDVVHLSPEGYDYAGDYYGRTLNDIIYGTPDAHVFYCTQAYPVGNTVVTVWNVPSPPIVNDTTTVPAAIANGIAYRISGGATITPLSTTISGNTIIVDIGQEPQLGDSIEFGNNTTSKPGVGDFPIVNFRDSSTETGTVTGEPLHSWAPLSEIEVTEAPPPSGGGFLCGGLSLGIGIGINSQAMCFGSGDPRLPFDYSGADYSPDDYLT